MVVPDADDVAARLRALLAELDERPPVPGADAVVAGHRSGAANLADYLCVRRHDLRQLQLRLARLGLSSLGRSEAHVRATVGAASRACDVLAGRPAPEVDTSGFEDGPAQLAAHTDALFGPEPPGRRVRIMVTLPSQAADDGGALVADLVGAGMDCARINTAHGDPGAWRRMVDGVSDAAARLDRPCTVVADLAGPKLRTGPLVEGPRVVRIRPHKDPLGRITHPAVVVLVPAGGSSRAPVAGATVVPVMGSLLDDVVEGDEIVVGDARAKVRSMQVRAVAPGRVVAELDRTTWLESGAQLRRVGAGDTTRGQVADLPPRRLAIRLSEGDELVLTADLTPTRPPGPGEVARIGCTLPLALRAVRPGHRVELDDGAIGGEAVAVKDGEVTVRITRAARGAKLRGEKGINLPDTDLPVASLGPDDLAALDAIGPRADAVALSFVRCAADVHELQDELSARGIAPGIIVKIETAQAFARLPEVLVAAMRSDRVGVMIARGDLAVETGYERTAELQEEILWACEAAHLPVVWATQVLEGLAKTGRPTRAEVTDAAMAIRAECVMLNKGPHIVAAVSMLDDILSRMSSHQHKKAPLLRQLRSW